MASTAAGMARLQLRQFVPKSCIGSTASCSYSTTATPFRRAPRASHSRRTAASETNRAFGTSTAQSSSWPAGAVADELPSSIVKGKARELISIPSPPRSKTIAEIHALKHDRTPIVCLTAHDFPSALSIRSAPVDLCLVGDSLANVALGYTSTQPLSLDAMIHHCQAVKRGLDAPLLSTALVDVPQSPLVIADMPFGSVFGSIDSAVAAVVKLMQETGVDGVKIEGSYEIVPLIKRLTDCGIPVMGHLGLQPQRVGATSGYRVQGKTAEQAKDILDEALALQEAGCFSIVLECIPTRLGEYISARLDVPTIGIGAGSKTDGQILVMNDMIGDLTGAGHVLAALSEPSPQTQPHGSASEPLIEQMPVTSLLTPPGPKFVRNFSQPSTTSIGALRIAAVQAYTQAVREGTFPDDNREGYKVKSDEWKRFLELAQA